MPRFLSHPLTLLFNLPLICSSTYPPTHSSSLILLWPLAPPCQLSSNLPTSMKVWFSWDQLEVDIPLLVYIHTHILTHIRTYTYLQKNICTYQYTHINIHINAYSHTRAIMHIYIHTHTYTYIHTWCVHLRFYRNSLYCIGQIEMRWQITTTGYKI